MNVPKYLILPTVFACVVAIMIVATSLRFFLTYGVSEGTVVGVLAASGVMIAFSVPLFFAGIWFSKRLMRAQTNHPHDE